MGKAKSDHQENAFCSSQRRQPNTYAVFIEPVSPRHFRSESWVKEKLNNFYNYSSWTEARWSTKEYTVQSRFAYLLLLGIMIEITKLGYVGPS